MTEYKCGDNRIYVMKSDEFENSFCENEMDEVIEVEHHETDIHKPKISLPRINLILRNIKKVHYCKLEKFADCITGTLKIPTNEGISHEMAFYLYDRKIFLIGDKSFIESIIKQALDVFEDNESVGIRQILLAFLEILIQDDVLKLQEIEDTISTMEEDLTKKILHDFQKQMLPYRKKLFNLQVYYEQLTDMGDMMQANVGEIPEEEETRGWAHFTARADRLNNHVEMLREYLMQVRELYQEQVNAEQNKIITFLTVITTIFLPLTLIVGWYGMNFSTMPELTWSYGYAAVIALSATIVIGEVIYFKKKKML